MTASRVDAEPLSDERARREILAREALAFVAELHGRFDARPARAARRAARARGALRAAELASWTRPREIRERRLAASPRRRADYADRRVEITGPTDRKLVINALNSGARGLHGRLRGRQLARPGANQVGGT